jgi:hypothetical protein
VTIDPAILAAIDPIARDLGQKAAASLLIQLGIDDEISGERRTDIERAHTALIAIRACMAHGEHEAALFASMASGCEATLELALDGARLDRAWREIDARSAFLAGAMAGAAAGARVLGPIALRMALAAVVV